MRYICIYNIIFIYDCNIYVDIISHAAKVLIAFVPLSLLQFWAARRRQDQSSLVLEVSGIHDVIACSATINWKNSSSSSSSSSSSLVLAPAKFCIWICQESLNRLNLCWKTHAGHKKSSGFVVEAYVHTSHLWKTWEQGKCWSSYPVKETSKPKPSNLEVLLWGSIWALGLAWQITEPSNP